MTPGWAAPAGQIVPVQEPSQAAEARRAATTLAREAGLNELDAARAALVAMEAATNLFKHTPGGEVVLQPRPGSLEVFALDRGPGMSDVDRSLTDGYSTAGSPGTGLGAIRRQASDFDLYSVPGQGTVLWARVAPRGPRPPSPVAVGALSLPHRGEEVCGDAWLVQAAPRTIRVLLADGLGHGDLAWQAATAAAHVAESEPELGLVALMQAVHLALRSTRGAAVAAAELSPDERLVRYAGVGNIAGFIWSPDGTRHMVSQPGTAGHELRRVQEFSYRWPETGVLVMHSDGLSTQTRLEGYPGLHLCQPAVMAGLLYRDFNRGRDDATVVVVRTVEQP